MKEKIIKENRVTISGVIVSDFIFSHEVFGEGFYVSNLSVYRTSGNADVIPIMVPDRLIDVKEDWKRRQVKIEGQFRSYNEHTDSGNHLILSVFVREFEELSGEVIGTFYYDNSIFLDGYICKQPNYRKTPLGREIADILLAVNRPYGKSDYIPCICWGRNARYVGNIEVGTHISVAGRIQSREYQKKISDDEFETRTAYEVSVGKIETVEETEE